MNRQALSKLQDFFNVAVFDGKLKKIPVSYTPIKAVENAIAFYQFDTSNGKSLRIVIDNRVKYVPVGYLLLHEMTHQWEHEVLGYTRKGRKIHNKRFKKKIRSLHKKLGWKPPPAWSLRG